MNEKSKSRLSMVRGSLIVLAAAAISFLIGGGWHFLVPSDQFVYGIFYNEHSPDEIATADRTVFLYCGPLAGLSGGLITLGFLLVRRNLRKDAPRA